MKTFYTRSLTAIAFAAVMLTGLLWNKPVFLLLFSGINFFALREYFQLIQKIDPAYQDVSNWHRAGIQVAAGSMLLWFTGDYFRIGPVDAGFLGMWLTMIVLVVLPLGEILLGKEFVLKNMGYSALGLLYLPFSFGLLIHLRFNSFQLFKETEFAADFGRVIPAAIVFMIWINDTMAYIVGSLIGRRPFFPAISPKKTWEGTVGGMLLTIIAAGTIGYYTQLMSIAFWIGLSALVAVMGTFGDLLESKLKRMAGVKDTGHIMPGHGGLLDRFDSLLFATPFAWLYVSLFL